MSLSSICGKRYKTWDYGIKKIIWDQFIRSIDSVWANISEWFWRFHYLDSVRFYYNARWSLFESKYRLQLLYEREIIADEEFISTEKMLNTLWIKLNNFIAYTKRKCKSGR